MKPLRYRRLAPRARAALFLFLIIGASAVFASEKRPLGIDDVLQMQGIGRVALARNGRSIIYEFVPAYENAPNLDTLYTLADRSALAKIYAIDIDDRRGRERLLFDQEPSGGYWMAGLSPTEEFLPVYRLHNRQVHAGALDLATGRLNWFNFTPNYFWLTQQPVWISNDELIYPALPEGEQPSIVWKPDIASRMTALWEKAFAGRESSATVMNSTTDGISLANQFRPGALYIANARTGSARPIASGYYYNLRLSPDRRYLAALREAGAIQPDPSIPVVWREKRLQLVVLDLKKQFSAAIVCDECNVALGSLQWSAASDRIAFSSRRVGDQKLAHELNQYSADSGRLQSIATPSPWYTCPQSGAPIAAPVGRDGEVVAFIRESQGPACASAGRGDWFVLARSGPVNLTSGFREIRGLLGIDDDAVVLLADGDAWRVDVSGKRVKLARFTGRTSSWAKGQTAETVSQEITFTGRPLDYVASILEGESSITRLDLQTGAMKSFRKPTGDAKLLAVSANGSAGAFRVDSDEGSEVIVSTSAGNKTVLRTNTHLRSVTNIRYLSVKYVFAGQQLTSCVAVPPDWVATRRYATIVYVYPYAKPWDCGPAALSEFNPYSLQLLAAHGYVVLYAVNPAALVRQEGRPLAGLTSAVLAAVDGAAAAGITDKNRVGLWGLSQGYGSVLHVLTQTDVFKAAVVSHGISDFTSAYGSIPLYSRMNADSSSFGDAARFENNYGANGLDLPPWAAPQLYVENSPLYKADKITTPLLLMNSDFDAFALAQSEQMFSALYRLRREASYVTYWGEGHGNLSPANIRDMWQRIFDWYDRNLGEVDAHHR